MRTYGNGTVPNNHEAYDMVHFIQLGIFGTFAIFILTVCCWLRWYCNRRQHQPANGLQTASWLTYTGFNNGDTSSEDISSDAS